MSDPNDRAYQAGASGGMFTGSTASEAAAFAAGQSTRPRAGGQPMPPGAVRGFVLIICYPIVYTVLGALYPLAGLLMLLCLTVILELMQGIGAILVYLMAMIWLSISLGLGIALEKILERHLWYRRLRHVARILMIGFIVHVLAFGFFKEFNPSTSFFERLTLTHVIIVALGCVGAHFLSRKLDAGLRDRVSDRIPGVAWAMHRFNPRRKANEAALAALEERMRSGKR